MRADEFLDLTEGGDYLHDLAIEREAKILECLGVEGVTKGHCEDISRCGQRNDFIEACCTRRDEVKKRRNGFESSQVNRFDTKLRGNDLGEGLPGNNSLLEHDLLDRTP